MKTVNVLFSSEMEPAVLLTDVSFKEEDDDIFFIDDEPVYNYDERFDVYHNSARFGFKLVESFRIVDDVNTPIPVVTKTDIKEAYKLISVLHNLVDGSQLLAATQLATNPVWLHKSFVETGDLIEAMKLNLKTAFGVILLPGEL